MALNPLYQNKLREMIETPGSFQGTPGFQFALNTGLDAVGRSNSRQRGSGNALAALTQYGTGLALQDRGAEMDRLLRGAGQEQQYDLGTAANTNTATANANALELGRGALDVNRGRLSLDDRLGTGRLDLDRTTQGGQLDLGRDRLGLDTSRLGLDRELGMGAQANQRRGQDLDFGSTMYRSANDYELGLGRNENDAQRNWWDYSLGSQGQATNRYNAETDRGRARSQDFIGRDAAARAWQPSGPARSRFEDRRPAWARGY